MVKEQKIEPVTAERRAYLRELLRSFPAPTSSTVRSENLSARARAAGKEIFARTMRKAVEAKLPHNN